MRLALLLGLCGLIVAGCAGNRKKSPDLNATGGAQSVASRASKTNKPNIIVTPGTIVAGKISMVRADSGYVIATFPLGTMPAVDRRLNVYRDGLKVAELKVDKFQDDVNTVAVIMAGECKVGDEVREN